MAVTITPSSPLQSTTRDVVRVSHVARITLPLPSEITEPPAPMVREPCSVPSLPPSSYLFLEVWTIYPTRLTACITCLE